jgi:fumarate hydratase, class I
MKQEQHVPAGVPIHGYDFFPLIADSVMTRTTGFSDAPDKLVIIRPVILEHIAQEAFSRLSFMFTEHHLIQLIEACNDPAASENDRFVCASLLENARIAAGGVYPLCQDTGIATVFGWQDNGVLLSGHETAQSALSRGIETVYKNRALRFSTNSPVSFFTEHDPRNNMPAQITLFSSEGACAPSPAFTVPGGYPAMKMIFCAKGGGSSNKTVFLQETKATLTREAFTALLKQQIAKLGTAACPPYTIAVVAGGLSPEQNLMTLKLATCGAYDNLTTTPGDYGFRDPELEQMVMDSARETGFGAQFGGTVFALNARVIRLPRHGASCPVSIGVSCSAHRNLRALITANGYYIERTVEHPEALPGFAEAVSVLRPEKDSSTDGVRTVSTEGGIGTVLEQLKDCKPGERIRISGPLLVARDAAHARWKAFVDDGRPLPAYCTKYPVCYAGPAETPAGAVTGSFGPTTAGRMDTYADLLMSRGAALVTLAKGNRSTAWKAACATYGAFYLGTPGGIAALIAEEYITDQKIIDYEELGMEAVRLVTVRDLPAFVITTRTGADFYEQISC